MSSQYHTGGYPCGAEFDSNAPWNQDDDEVVDQTFSRPLTLEEEAEIEQNCIEAMKEWHRLFG